MSLHIKDNPDPDFSADPLSLLWAMRELPNFEDFYKYIHSYYCREFHAWMHDESLLLDKTGKMLDKAAGFFGWEVTE